MMDTVYIETSIISLIAARPSRDIQTAALQQQAHDWWEQERPKFDLVTSQLVIAEASAGDAAAVAERLKLLHGISFVDIGEPAKKLAEKIITLHLMPQKAAADALHVAAAALARVKYLLTFNCKHIANAHVLPRIYELLRSEGCGQLLICNPAEFLGDDEDDEKTANF